MPDILNLDASVERWIWILDTVVDWFRTESELRFWFSLYYGKFFEWKSLRAHDVAYSVEGKGSDVVIFTSSTFYELQAAILHCLEAAIHHSHPFLKISPENSGLESFF